MLTANKIGLSGLAAINGALESMVGPLALDLAPKLRVNAVSPGVIATPWWDSVGNFKDTIFAEAAASLPVRRVGYVSCLFFYVIVFLTFFFFPFYFSAPEDVASAVVAIATNGFITGQGKKLHFRAEYSSDTS
jgi:NAD(P)-dependent dehydrogenase (short-subunit alcohol dehydrogenase family)